jgi:hypothetical protein
MNSRNKSGAVALAGAAITGLIAFALFLAGGLMLWANHHYKDADGYFTTSSERFSSSGYAITADDLHIHGGLLRGGHYGTIRIDANGDKPVFIGVAPTAAVNRYLSGVASSQVGDLEVAPFSARYTQHPGSRAPGAPAAQKIWSTQASGDGRQTLTWNVADGDWSVVVMNADGSPAVRAALSAGAKVPYIAEVGFGALGLGVLFIAATAGLTLYGTRPATPRRVAVLA